MAAMVAATNTLTDLQSALRALDAGALLVSPRILRRILRAHFKVSGFGLTLPHRRGYPIDRDALLQLVDPAELGLSLEQASGLPQTVLLMEQPPNDLLALPRPQFLRLYWHRLFHLQVDRVLRQAIATGQLSDAVVRQRIDQLGRGEFDEIRSVLNQEKILLPPYDERHTYAEFVAVYLGLRHFAPDQLECYFPLLTDYARIDALIAQDVDAAPLLERSRLAGAAPPGPITPAVPEPEPSPPAPAVSAETRQQLDGQAQAAIARGNVVRAAILQASACPSGAPLSAATLAALDVLCQRLREALGLSDAETAAWRAALPLLLERATTGFWTRAGRLLYDLQKACVEQERIVATVDMVEWAASLGQRPIRREQPGLRGVRTLKYLRSAAARLQGILLPDAAHKELTHLLHQASERAEDQLRTHFRPLLHQALDTVGLVPRNLPERVARDKVVEVLLDHIAASGFFNLSQLRDALSANQLKVDEAFAPWWKSVALGDQLLLLNRHLAVVLDGVYRPGEIYLRWLQTLSFGFFGTPLGRFLTKFVLLPFGGAFVVLAGLFFLAEEGQVLLRLAHLLPPVEQANDEPDEFADEPPKGHKHHAMPWDAVGVEPFAAATLGLGVFLLLLLHVPPFRAAIGQGLHRLGHGLRLLLIDAPLWLLRLPFLQALVYSWPVQWFGRYALRPLLAAAVAVLVAWFLGGRGVRLLFGLGAGIFAAAAILLQTRLVRDAEETLTDTLARTWHYLTVDLLPGVFAFIMWLSGWFLDGVERVLYTVDEWLLFRQGESRLALVAKAVLGVFWFAVTYVVRIYTNLLVEPTVNPIKHFPVVTVGHKLMLPIVPHVFHILVAVMLPLLGELLATGLAGVTLFFIPGIFGFIAWELQANWRLYRENRSATLRPVLVGSHGETVPRLLRPGFHSGTIPKLFRNLRRAVRHDRTVALHKRADRALHHVDEELHHFVERELLNLLRHSRRWGDREVTLAAIPLGCQRIRLEFGCAGLEGPPLAVAFDEEGGWLVGGVVQAGWLPQLTDEQRTALATALAGLYRLADVDLTREQLAAQLPPEKWRYHLAGYRLTVRPRDGSGAEAVYDLSADTLLTPRAADGRVVADLPVLDASQLLLTKVPVLWTDWVRVWDADQAKEPTPPLTATEMRLLPMA